MSLDQMMKIELEIEFQLDLDSKEHQQLMNIKMFNSGNEEKYEMKIGRPKQSKNELKTLICRKQIMIRGDNYYKCYKWYTVPQKKGFLRHFCEWQKISSIF